MLFGNREKGKESGRLEKRESLQESFASCFVGGDHFTRGTDCFPVTLGGSFLSCERPINISLITAN